MIFCAPCRNSTPSWLCFPVIEEFPGNERLIFFLRPVKMREIFRGSTAKTRKRAYRKIPSARQRQTPRRGHAGRGRAEEADARGRKIQTTYTVDQVYPLFKDFVQRRFRANTDLNQVFLMHNATQNLIANDVQHWRYAYYTYDRRQLTSGFGETQVAYHPWKRRLHAQQPSERAKQVVARRRLAGSMVSSIWRQ